jgi:hypothetical protein
MGPRTGLHSSGSLKQLLSEARAGSDQSLRRLLTACREYLLAIAVAEMATGPERAIEAEQLVDAAMSEVAALPNTLDGDSDDELRERLRQILLGRLQAQTFRQQVADDGPHTREHPAHDENSAPTPQPADTDLSGAGPPALARECADRAAEDSGSPADRPTVPEQNGVVFDESADLFLPGIPQLPGFERLTPISVNSGMGVVYRAWQTRAKRWVALKWLPPHFAEDPDRRERFQQEIEVAAGLTEHGVVPVYDVIDSGDTPVLVMSYIDGCDLNKILTNRRDLRRGKQVDDPHDVAQYSDRDYVTWVLPFFDRCLDALVSLHGAGVLHRDLKPSNILVDKSGHGWLTDFGLARPHRANVCETPGRAMGTAGFMSPEQWSGAENIDARADVFSMGATIYQALTLRLPYGKGPVGETTPGAALSKAEQKHWPSDLDLVIQAAIHPDRKMRYRTTGELFEDWQRVRKGLLPRNTRVGLGRRVRHEVRRHRLEVISGVGCVAAALGCLLLFLPGNFVRTVRVTSAPAGARVALVPLRESDGAPQFDKAIEPRTKTPVDVPRVRPGNYLVIAEVSGYGFHEVYRRVPDKGESVRFVSLLTTQNESNQVDATDSPEPLGEPGVSFAHLAFEEHDDLVELPSISIPREGAHPDMVLLSGGRFVMGSEDKAPMFAPPHECTVAPFYLDQTEVSVAQYRAVRGDVPVVLRKAKPNDRDPVTLVSFDQAVRCAEEMGKRLPDEAEYEFAATNGGHDSFPWGDEGGRSKP